MVKGVIRDPDGNPLAVLPSRKKGTTNTVVAGANGDFTISVKEGATLVVSYVGFETRELPDNRRRMRKTLIRLDRTDAEVVVTALGIRKEKTKISYATQEVKGAALEKAPEPNVAKNLIGKVAGLEYTSKNKSV